jgi:Flp pilus assembly protein protease CpaA
VAKTFFPDPVFAWVFCLTLILLTSLAAWIDTRKAIVPNRLTVLIFILGLVANAIRGGWLAAENHPVWWLSEGGASWLGVLDGLLFGLVGFIIIFALMFAFWIFGLCGGGDVKLMAAVAAWMGMPNFLLLWLATLVVLIFWTLGQVLMGGLSPQRVKKNLRELGQSPKDRAAEQAPSGKRGQLRTTFSFPVAVATAVVLLWLFRVELQLVQPKPPADQPQGVSCHVRPTPLFT